MSFFELLERVTIPTLPAAADRTDMAEMNNPPENAPPAAVEQVTAEYPEPAATTGISSRPAPKRKRLFSLQKWQIVMNHLPAMLAAGWIREQIFRRTRGTSGYLDQGIAFLSAWEKPGLAVSIDKKKGTIHFIFTNATGKRVTQSIQIPISKDPKTKKIDQE
jgi:hypothetical protein